MGPERAALVIGWAVLGGLVGLALDRIIYNLPQGRRPTSAPRCWSCEAGIPLLGRPVGSACANCGRQLAFDRVELLALGLFGALAFSHGWSRELVMFSIYAAILLIIAVVDARYRYVYTLVSYPAILLALVLSAIVAPTFFLAPLGGLLLGGGIFLGFYLLGRVLYGGAEPMGFGDVTIAALLGAMVGVPRVLMALILGASLSAMIGLGIVLARRGGRRTYVPFGPGLCAGATVTFFLAP